MVQFPEFFCFQRAQGRAQGRAPVRTTGRVTTFFAVSTLMVLSSSISLLRSVHVGCVMAFTSNPKFSMVSIMKSRFLVQQQKQDRYMQQQQHKRSVSSKLLRSASSSSSSFSPSVDSVASYEDTPDQLPDFGSREEYLSYMERVSSLPKGFATGTADGTFVSVEAPGMGKLPIRGTVIYLTEGPTDNWAAVFTSNKFPGSPVIVGRNRLAGGGPLHAIVINNKVSNVCSGGDGVADSELVCEAVADALNLPGGAKTVLPSSTGVIGWRLPAKELATDIVPRAVTELQSVSALNAATAICTTDRWPKVRSATLKSNGGRIVGIAKGAGMIEPNMATMLSYIMTDVSIPKSSLQRMLSEIANDSFNSISVDGDESTSDTLVLLSSNQISGSKNDGTTINEDEFRSALERVCKGLAADLVRNGEGTGHVMKVTIENFPGTNLEARRLGRHIVNSPLFKCAVSGNDPNTGRLAAAIGSFMGKFKNAESVADVSLTLGGRCIFTSGKFVLEGQAVEEELSQHMKTAGYNEHSDYPPHQKFVELGVDFGNNNKGEKSNVVVYGSDLTAEYVAVNGDYRS